MNYYNRIHDLLVEAQVNEGFKDTLKKAAMVGLATVAPFAGGASAKASSRTPFQGPSVTRNYQPSRADKLAEKPITRYDPTKASKQEHAFKKTARTPKIVPGA